MTANDLGRGCPQPMKRELLFHWQGTKCSMYMHTFLEIGYVKGMYLHQRYVKIAAKAMLMENLNCFQYSEAFKKENQIFRKKNFGHKFLGKVGQILITIPIKV